jgi:hypothetical protein
MKGALFYTGSSVSIIGRMRESLFLLKCICYERRIKQFSKIETVEDFRKDLMVAAVGTSVLVLCPVNCVD